MPDYTYEDAIAYEAGLMTDPDQLEQFERALERDPALRALCDRAAELVRDEELEQLVARAADQLAAKLRGGLAEPSRAEARPQRPILETRIVPELKGGHAETGIPALEVPWIKADNRTGYLTVRQWDAPELADGRVSIVVKRFVGEDLQETYAPVPCQLTRSDEPKWDEQSQSERTFWYASVPLRTLVPNPDRHSTYTCQVFAVPSTVTEQGSNA